MDISRFFYSYNLAILKYLLKDKDFKISIFQNNKELFVKQTKYKLFQHEPFLARRISKQELDKYIQENISQYDQNVWMSQGIYFEREDIEYLLNNKSSLSYELSLAQVLNWADELIEKYINSWNWYSLSRNKSFIWTKDRIKKFKPYIQFESLSYNTSLEIDQEIINNYEDLWDWNGISGNPGILESSEDFIFNHPKIIWKVAPMSYSYYEGGTYPLSTLKKLYTTSHWGNWSIKLCICTNPGIYWDLNKFERYRSKIDFWLLALFGNIDFEVIDKFGDELNENRVFSISYRKWSDWYDKHPVYRNGWENWLLNDFVFVDLNLLWKILSKSVKLIRHNGDARDGFEPYEIRTTLNTIIPPEKIKMSFEDALDHFEFLPENLIQQNEIDQHFYFNVVKPAFICNPTLLESLFKSF